MDLERMLAMCRRDQWSAQDIDLSTPPRPMSREDEELVVQLFTNMAGIERLAAALFVEQERRVKNPTLREIFKTFVVDEVRHAHAAQMLADHYDVHHFKSYQLCPALARFFPVFIDAIRELDDDVANAYITSGELLLDIALLRSVNDYVHDRTSDQVMTLVNRDESRHIAIDFHMAEYYCSPEYRAAREAKPPRSRQQQIKAAKTFALLIAAAKPFITDVFLRPMDVVDPSGKRLREAFKRMQLVGSMPGSQELPFSKFLATLQRMYETPVIGTVLGPAITRLSGIEGRFFRRLHSEEEAAHARAIGFDGLAEEALAIKYQAS